MNELIDRLFELPTRQRVLLLVGSVGLLFFLYAYFIYWPRSERIESKSTQLTALRKERDTKAKLAADLENARRIVADLEASLKEAVAQLPDTKEIPDLLSAVSGVGQESGLTIAQFRQLPSVVRDFYAEVPVQILVRGTFFQVESFFDRVGELTRIVNVGEIGIRAPSDIRRDPIQLETSCRATTFRFLTEAEREEIARKKKQQGKK
jgi:type IV pilus assembly protein PilO